MTAPKSVDPAGFLREQPEAASPDLLRATVKTFKLVVSVAHRGLSTRSAPRYPARPGRAHQSTSSVAGWSRWFTSAARRGPWQRDLRGPAADPSLPAVQASLWAVGVVPRAPR
jgi:hypothetical protein